MKHDRLMVTMHRRLCKWFGFDHVDKCYQHKVETVLENNHQVIDQPFHSNKIGFYNRD